MQLIPARGRLHSVNREKFSELQDAAYPREGTVTAGASYRIDSVTLMQLIPARGRLRLPVLIW